MPTLAYVYHQVPIVVCSSVGVTPPCGGVEVDGVAVLPVPHILEGWLGFERNGRGAATPVARFGDNIHAPTQFLKRLLIFVQIRL